MKKLSLFASVSAALVGAAVPASFNWSPANVTLFSLVTAEARVGRPLTATSVAGVAGESMGANTAARQQERRSREDGAEPNRTVINFAGRHSGNRDEATGVFPVGVVSLLAQPCTLGLSRFNEYAA
jgi:hypothetical protein